MDCRCSNTSRSRREPRGTAHWRRRSLRVGRGVELRNLIVVEPAVGSTPPWAGVTPAPSEGKERCGTSSLLEVFGGRNPNLPLSEGRSARAEGERRERYNAGHITDARCAAVERRNSSLRIEIKRVGVGALSGVAPLPATPLRGFRRPLLGQGEVRISDALAFICTALLEICAR
jgi:hypothetical protein